MYPGKELVSVKIDGVKQHTQKSAIMLFKRNVHCILEKYTSTDWLFKIFSKRLKRCLTVNSGSNIHYVHVCEIYQNVKHLTTVSNVTTKNCLL